MWCTDSTNLVTFLTKGSRQAEIQNLIFNIMKCSSEIDCIISPVHLYREHERIQEVDFLSKCPDSDNWSIDMASFNRLNNRFKFRTNLFAGSNNKRTDQGHKDAFSIQWSAVDLSTNITIDQCHQMYLELHMARSTNSAKLASIRFLL